MQPSQFLALLQESQQGTAADSAEASARFYRAFEASPTPEHFLTLHTPGGKIAAFPYGGLAQISGDHAAGTRYRLKFAGIYVELEGVSLSPVFDAIRTRRAAHVYQLNPEKHDMPQGEGPVILTITFRAMKAPGADVGSKDDNPQQRAAE